MKMHRNGHTIHRVPLGISCDRVVDRYPLDPLGTFSHTHSMHSPSRVVFHTTSVALSTWKGTKIQCCVKEKVKIY